MKYLLSLLLLAMLAVSFNVSAQGCDPRYYKPNTCEPYYTHPNPQLPHNPMHTTSRNPADYTHGRMGVNSGYPRMGACAYGSCGGYVGNTNYGYGYGYGSTGHVRGDVGYGGQQRYVRWGISANLGRYDKHTGAGIGFHVEGGKSGQR